MVRLLLICLIFHIVIFGCNNQNKLEERLSKDLIDSHKNLIESNKKIYNRDPKNYEALLQLAYSSQQLENYRLAIIYYKKLLKLYPDDFVAQNNLADIYEKQDKLKLAEEVLSSLYAKNKDNFQVVYDYVRIKSKLNKDLDATKLINEFSSIVQDEAAIQTLQDLLN